MLVPLILWTREAPETRAAGLTRTAVAALRPAAARASPSASLAPVTLITVVPRPANLPRERLPPARAARAIQPISHPPAAVKRTPPSAPWSSPCVVQGSTTKTLGALSTVAGGCETESTARTARAGRPPYATKGNRSNGQDCTHTAPRVTERLGERWGRPPTGGCLSLAMVVQESGHPSASLRFKCPMSGKSRRAPGGHRARF